jgi:long-chain fatty acid transport protein
VKKQAIWGLVALSMVGAVLGFATEAHAGGYDTPMLYTARHQGMGGTAISYVDDGSAFFHNPAGIGAYDTANVLLGVGLLMGGIQASPSDSARSIDSETTIAPLPLLGGGARLFNTNPGGENNFALVIGAGVFPVASAGGAYTYPASGGMGEVNDSTTLVFLEVAPGIGLALEDTPVGDFRLGVTYRMTYVSLTRTIENPGGTFVDFNSTGLNFAGFRLGFQWQPIEEIQFGFTYRHRIDTDIASDGGTVFGMPADEVRTTFTLPGKLGWGIRGDYMNVGLAFDLEYSLNSQNRANPVVGTPSGGGADISVPNVFNWSDALTLRVGGEYKIEIDEERSVKPRLGFVFDDKTSNSMWPTAFGTPPAPTFVLSAGVGYDGGAWQLNAAYAYRWGSVTITPEERNAGDALAPCSFCGYPGDYAIGLHGIYLDFSYDFE